MIEADLLRALERRVAALEREVREQQDVASSEPSHALRELKHQMDAFKTKLETTEHLSWLGKLYFSKCFLPHSIAPDVLIRFPFIESYIIYDIQLMINDSIPIFSCNYILFIKINKD